MHGNSPSLSPLPLHQNYFNFICSTSKATANGWYDQYGLKCLDCQRATDTGILPPIVFNNRDSWFTTWKLESEFNLHSATVRKMVKNGLLKARIVKDENEKDHYYVFLINENLEFFRGLKKYYSK